jgi:hypothetical protein
MFKILEHVSIYSMTNTLTGAETEALDGTQQQTPNKSVLPNKDSIARSLHKLATTLTVFRKCALASIDPTHCRAP